MLFADCMNDVLGSKEKNGGFECYEQGEGVGEFNDGEDEEELEEEELEEGE